MDPAANGCHPHIFDFPVDWCNALAYIEIGVTSDSCTRVRISQRRKNWPMHLRIVFAIASCSHALAWLWMAFYMSGRAGGFPSTFRNKWAQNILSGYYIISYSVIVYYHMLSDIPPLSYTVWCRALGSFSTFVSWWSYICINWLISEILAKVRIMDRDWCAGLLAGLERVGTLGFYWLALENVLGMVP